MSADALQNAIHLHRQGKLQEAASAYQAILQNRPDHPDALHYLGVLMHQAGRPRQAAALIEQAIALAPGKAEMWCNLGAVLQADGQTGRALTCYAEAVRLEPQNANAHYHLGTLYLETGAAKAEQHLRRACRLMPGHALAASNLGLLLQRLGSLAEAETVLRAALAQAPHLGDAHRNLAVTLEQQGRAHEATEHYRHALAAAPQDAGLHSALLLCMHNVADISPAELFAEAQTWGARHAPDALRLPPPEPNQRQRIRIGYVSADLHTHPVAMFLESVLAAHDRSAFHLTAYASQRVEDATTLRLKVLMDEWHDISRLSDDEAARLIRSHGVDLLIDLGGHTGGSRLGVFARKPAAAQAAWLGYFDTTGMRAMDYLIADSHVLPPDAPAYCTEKILRLPDYYLCFTPPREAGTVAPLPALTQQYITFGSFNRLSKLTPPVIALWAEILKSIPDSQPMIKSKGCDDKPTAARLVDAFARHAIAPDRLVLEGHTSLEAMYAAYGRVDIALDPFPHNGGTTSAQSLWCGVPVLTLEGDRFVSRMGQGLMRVLGLEEWVAKDTADYVEKARRHAGDISALAALRAGLRERMRASPLCDAPRFTRALEACYREILNGKT